MKPQEFGNPLESPLSPKLSLIRVDAEGYDIQILKTLSSVISERKPFIRQRFTSIRILNIAGNSTGSSQNIITSFIKRKARDVSEDRFSENPIR